MSWVWMREIKLKRQVILKEIVKELRFVASVSTCAHGGEWLKFKYFKYSQLLLKVNKRRCVMNWKIFCFMANLTTVEVKFK